MVISINLIPHIKAQLCWETNHLSPSDEWTAYRRTILPLMITMFVCLFGLCWVVTFFSTHLEYLPRWDSSAGSQLVCLIVCLSDRLVELRLSGCYCNFCSFSIFFVLHVHLATKRFSLLLATNHPAACAYILQISEFTTNLFVVTSAAAVHVAVVATSLNLITRSNCCNHWRQATSTWRKL